MFLTFFFKKTGHLQDLRKASAKEKDAFETLNKAAQLKQRDLFRYMKQLSLSKLECERRLAVLGRPDFRVRNSFPPVFWFSSGVPRWG